MEKFILYKNKINKYIIKKYNKDTIEIALSSAILLFLWQLIALIIDNDIYIPAIGEVLKNTIEIVSQDIFVINIGVTMGRSIISFIISLTVAIIIAVLGYINKKIINFFKPINVLAQSIPMMILIVLALIWFDKDKAPFIVGTMMIFPVLYECILQSIVDIDKSLIEMTKIYNLSIVDKIKNIYLPCIKFRLFSIIASTISLVLKIVIAGEIYGQPRYGIGSMIQIEKANFNTSGIIAWLMIIVAITIFLNIIQKSILRSTFLWKR